MANEAVIIELLGNGGDPIRFTVSDANAIAKGTIMRITDPRTASATSAADQPICGIAASAKTALDGQVTLACYTNGIFDIVNATGAATCGALQAPNGANTVTNADAADLLQGSIVGQALETGGTPETIAIRVLR